MLELTTQAAAVLVKAATAIGAAQTMKLSRVPAENWGRITSASFGASAPRAPDRLNSPW